MKRWLLLLPFVLACLTTPLLSAPYRHAPTGVVVPDGTGPFERGDPQTYGGGTAESGIAFPFSSGTATISLFLRNEPSASSQTAAAAVDDTVQAIRANPNYSDVKLVPLASHLRREGWNTAALTARVDDREITTFVSCTLREGRLVKIRATTTRLENFELTSFLNQLRNALDSSTARE